MAPVTLQVTWGLFLKSFLLWQSARCPPAGAPSCLRAGRDTSPSGSPMALPGAQADPLPCRSPLAPVGAGQCHRQLGGKGRDVACLRSSLWRDGGWP